MRAMMKSSRVAFACLLVASVMLAEMQAVMADTSAEMAPTDKKATLKTITKKAKAPKIKRTIRLLEEPTVSEPAKEAEPVPAQPQSVEMKNVGPTNQVDVNPNISIAAPAAPIVSEPIESDDAENAPANMQLVPVNQLPQPQQPISQLALVDQASNNNKFAQLTADSGNQLLNLGQNNGNVLSKVLSNSGNTETVHIDGVGNNKVTRISNAGNNEEQHVDLPAPRRQAPIEAQPQLAPVANLPPLVQISMNNDGQVAPVKPAVNYLTAAGVPFDMRASTMMSPFVYPQMAMQSPMMMVQPSPMMMMPGQAPMMMMSTMITPRQWLRLMRSERKHRRCRHHDHADHEDVKKDKTKKKKKNKSKKPKREEKPAQVIEIHHKEEPKPEETQVEHQVIEVPKKPEESKIVQLIKPVEAKPEPKIAVVTQKPEEEEKDEEEEVIEWETVRVPKKRMVLKPKKSSNQ